MSTDLYAAIAVFTAAAERVKTAHENAAEATRELAACVSTEALVLKSGTAVAPAISRSTCRASAAMVVTTREVTEAHIVFRAAHVTLLSAVGALPDAP